MYTSQSRGQVTLDFTNDVRLRFELNDTLVCQAWLRLLQAVSPAHLAPGDYNHRHGFASEQQINAAIALLRQYAASLGYRLESLNPRNWQDALNQLHKFFPPSFKRSLTKPQFLHAHQMNLIIHWLEQELENKLLNRQKYCFIFDFNHIPSIYKMKQRLTIHDLARFEPHIDFGTIYLHYIHIGKHFLEMFDAYDVQCPADQFVPQTQFNATFGVALHEPSDQRATVEEFERFYREAGGYAKFGINFGDPRLAIGFYPLGQLVDINRFKDAAARQNLRDRLSSSTVIDWSCVEWNTPTMTDMRARNDTASMLTAAPLQPLQRLEKNLKHHVER